MSVTPSGSPESPTNQSFSKAPNSLPNDHLTEGTPKSNIPDEYLEEVLVKPGPPDYASSINPDTHEVKYTPYAKPEEVSSSKSWLKYVAGTGLVSVVLGSVIFATRGGEEEVPQTPRTPSASAPASPGATATTPEQPTPSASPTEQLSQLEQQRQLYRRLEVPPTSVSKELLESYQDPDALNSPDFLGVNGGAGFFPNVKRVLIDQQLAFGSMRAEDFAAAIDRQNEAFTGTHLDVIDGKLTTVPNIKLMEDGEFRSVITPEVIEFHADGLKAQGDVPVEAIATAGTLASDGFDLISIQLAAKLAGAEARVAEFRLTHPESNQTMTETSMVEMISSAFALEQQPNSIGIENRATLARGLLTGEIKGLDGPNYSDCRITDVHETTLTTADGKTTTTMLGVSIVGKEQGNGAPFAMTVALIPAEKTLDIDKANPNKYVLADAPAGSYRALVVSKTNP